MALVFLTEHVWAHNVINISQGQTMTNVPNHSKCDIFNFSPHSTTIQFNIVSIY